LAIGPVAAGALLESTGSVEALLWASMTFIAAGLGSAAYVLARRAPALSLQADPIAVKP